jgi:uncharacterized membrane protein YqhA
LLEETVRSWKAPNHKLEGYEHMKDRSTLLETGLWKSRGAAIFAVLGCLLMALIVLFVATADVVRLLGALGAYVNPALAEDAVQKMHLAIIVEVIGILDTYLLAAVLFIVALGLYEIFISKIDVAKETDVASDLLMIRNVDDLKSRLGTMVLLLLVVKLVQQALQYKYESVIELVGLSAAILLVSGALYLAQRHEGAGH